MLGCRAPFFQYLLIFLFFFHSHFIHLNTSNFFTHSFSLLSIYLSFLSSYRVLVFFLWLFFGIFCFIFNSLLIIYISNSLPTPLFLHFHSVSIPLLTFHRLFFHLLLCILLLASFLLVPFQVMFSVPAIPLSLIKAYFQPLTRISFVVARQFMEFFVRFYTILVIKLKPNASWLLTMVV